MQDFLRALVRMCDVQNLLRSSKQILVNKKQAR